VQWRPQAIGTESLITRRLEYRVDPSPEGAVGVPPRRSFGGKGGYKVIGYRRRWWSTIGVSAKESRQQRWQQQWAAACK